MKAIILGTTLLFACTPQKKKKDQFAPSSATKDLATEKQEPDPKTPEPEEDPIDPNAKPALTVSTNSFDCNKLDYGIYWFGTGDVAQKYEKGYRFSFFDRKKPTVLYVHGWQAGSHLIGKRSSFNYIKTDKFVGIDKNAADAWVAAGWNIGVFYWNQISDETFTRPVEDKIWEKDAVTWQNCEGKALKDGLPEGDMSDILFNLYTEAMKGYKGPNIRLVGHSLGNQLVTRLADKLSEAQKAGTIDAKLLPKRVALLDPWWTRGTTSWEWRGRKVLPIISRLKAEGMIFERYNTTTMAELNVIGDANPELSKIIGQIDLHPEYIGKVNQPSRHTSAPFLYFMTMGDPPIRGCKANCELTAPSAAAPDAIMKAYMDQAIHWEKVQGLETAETSDDVFDKFVEKPE